jgi:hypothetical protein
MFRGSYIFSLGPTLVCLLLSLGCSPYPKVAPKVDQEKALQVLHIALDAWKAGKPITDLAQVSDKIVAQDFDWMQNKKLVSYEVMGKGIPQDANLRVEVSLRFDGETQAQRVAYIVGTAPVQTVFRAFE